MLKKVNYFTLPEDEMYIVINPVEGIGSILHDYSIEKDVYILFQSMHYGLFMYENSNGLKNTKEVLISKFSDIGKYIITHPERFENDDLNVTYKKVVNAFNISVFTDDKEMEEKILPLFKNRVEGNKKDLVKYVDINTLNYILKNKSFDEYLKKLDDKSDFKEYVVFEDGIYTSKKIEKVKMMIKR